MEGGPTVEDAVLSKANQATTYTETEVNNLLDAKAAISGQAFSGNISASNLSGTNTGDQTNISGNAATVSNLTTNQVGSATGGLSAGAVGSYGLFQSDITVGDNETISGSNLNLASADGITPNSSSPSGTWLSMGRTTGSGSGSNRTTIFLRVS
jgi:hypothetical protein